jgi:CheY-like chemotaxis protein
MLDHDDLKWIAANATELNGLLQQVSRYSDQARQHKGEEQYFDLLSEQVEQASKTSQALFDRVTARILTRTGVGAQTIGRSPNLTVVPPPRSSDHSRTSVSTRLPVGEVAVASAASGQAAIQNPDGERELILLVDDQPEILELAGAMLEFEDYRVILAKDGFEALRIYEQMSDEISLIILDFFLPVMDGDAVFDELKAINPAVNVVLSSGFGEQTKLSSMLARGLRGFIPKPYTHEKLIEQVRSIIEA